MKRKTLPVNLLLERANTYLAHSETSAEGREAIARFTESFLMEAGVYAGFMYLDENDKTFRRYDMK
jgi:hypothetical protein